ncbi:phosphatidylinositol phosphatase PTPRQ [Hyalella azteca]|uniref:protein-tyrosine-phosphatase n=1 Tax=Hyalella azteca TaxID=294128 RepID=A0A979FY87_HYAAZ|nr:phosphatidylinositol phosphatase PTPRQ [Hyalella azteca]
MIDASWELQEQTGMVSRYQVSWTPNGANKPTASCYVDTTKTNTSSCDVYPTIGSCTLYTVTVQPQTLSQSTPSFTGTPASAADYTLLDVSSPVTVTNVTCANIGQSITVSWGNAGACVEYVVSYTGVAMWGDRQVTIEPSAPLNLAFEGVTATSFTVTWLKPVQENGLIAEYQVQWISTDDSLKSQSILDTRLTIADLKPCVNYTVTVAASTSAGRGQESKASQQTVVAVPPAVGPPQMLFVSSRSTNLTWIKPDTKCTVVGYTVRFSGQAMWGVNATINDTSLKTITSAIQITGLKPFSKYSYTVTAATAAGEGAPSQPQYIQTEVDAPSEPTQLRAEALNSTSVRVSWLAPTEENGIITNYTIRSQLAGNGTEADKEQIITTPGNRFTCDVTGLVQCRVYNFSVAALTSRGEGPKISLQGSPMTTAPAAPQNLNCFLNDKGSLSVFWTKPETYCKITRFSITSNVTVKWSNVKFGFLNSTGERTPQLVLDQPYPDSDYTIQVKAVLGNSTNGAEVVCKITTAEAAPSAARNLTLLEARSNALVIQWEAPEKLNGIVRYYFVSSGRSDEVVRNVTLYVRPDETRFNCTVAGLTAGTHYNISVRAATTREGEAVVIQFTTASPDPEGVVVIALLVVMLIVGLSAAVYNHEVIREKFNSPSSSCGRKSGLIKRSSSNEDLRKGILDAILQFEDDGQKLLTAFEKLSASSRDATKDAGLRHQNAEKNRYHDILPFDDTRVILHDEWNTDYINASYVKDAVGSVRFIACQGPKPGTVPDFWHMVWQEQVKIIVMLTDCYEGREAKCATYWPEDVKSSFMAEKYIVTLLAEDEGSDYTQRKLLLQNEPSPAREIVQLHFTSWPAHGVPASEAGLLRFISSVKELVGNSDVPQASIVVHCSAGVGRTGTFIALWNLQQQHQRGAPIDIDATILKIREDRSLLVQSKEQYLFIFKCFAEYLRSTEIFNEYGSNSLATTSGDVRVVPSSNSTEPDDEAECAEALLKIEV